MSSLLIIGRRPLISLFNIIITGFGSAGPKGADPICTRARLHGISMKTFVHCALHKLYTYFCLAVALVIA